MSLSGTVDAKSAVRILRGHDDLLRVFRSKFAPRADLVAIKQELTEEDLDRGEEKRPRPPLANSGLHFSQGGIRPCCSTTATATW